MLRAKGMRKTISYTTEESEGEGRRYVRESRREQKEGTLALRLLKSDKLFEAVNDLRHRRAILILLIPHLTHEINDFSSPSTVETCE